MTQREITTVQELMKLPRGAVIRDSIGYVFERSMTGIHFETTGEDFNYSASGITLPALVLWEL